MTAPRLASLDVFRGFAIAAMVLVNNPGDWGALYPPLAHAEWHGWTFTDTVFPFFLFIVGVSMVLSLDVRAASGMPASRLLAGHARRCAVIFALGLGLNLLPQFDLQTLRVPGVLQRIALCSLLAAPLMLGLRWRGLLLSIAALFVLYTVPMLCLPVPGPDGVVATGLLQPGRDAGAWLDRLLLGGHLWARAGSWDPEGLLGTLPATATVLFGVLAGRWLMHPVIHPVVHPGSPAERTVWLFIAGLALLALGTLMDGLLMPINKNLWTPSYAVFMGGWSLLVLAALHWLLDAAPQPALRTAAARLAWPFTVYGMNALFLFVLSGLVARLLLFVKPDGGPSLKALSYAPLQNLPLPPAMASLLWALLFNLLMFSVAWVMWKKRWFIKA